MYFCLFVFCLFVFLSLHTSRSGGDKKHMWATVAGWLVGTTASATYSISLIVPGLLARHNDLLCYLDIRSGPRAANIPVLPSQTCFLILLLLYFIFLFSPDSRRLLVSWLSLCLHCSRAGHQYLQAAAKIEQFQLLRITFGKNFFFDLNFFVSVFLCLLQERKLSSVLFIGHSLQHCTHPLCPANWIWYSYLKQPLSLIRESIHKKMSQSYNYMHRRLDHNFSWIRYVCSQPSINKFQRNLETFQPGYYLK